MPHADAPRKDTRRPRSPFTLLGLLALLALPAGLLSYWQTSARAAATLVVNSTGDGADSNTADGLCDDGAGHCTLRAAIAQANQLAGTDTISFSVNGTINLTGALPDIASNMTISGPGAALLTVRRDTGGDYRVFKVASGVVSISGLTVANGKAPDSADPQVNSGTGEMGGGVFNDFSGALTLSDCVISDSVAGRGVNASGGNTLGGQGGRGGGIFNRGSLTVTNCAVRNNRAGQGGSGNKGGQGGSGGGLANEGTGTLTITGGTFSNNSAGDGGAGDGTFTSGGFGGSGGGIETTGQANISGTTISDNASGNGGQNGGGGWGGGRGGGIHVSGGTTTLTNSVVRDNRTGAASAPAGASGEGGYGGGVYNISTLVVNGSTISGNQTGASGAGATGGFGGGVGNGGTLKMTNSTVSGNVTNGPGGQGAGIWNYGAVTLTNCTVYANTSAANAGGAGLHTLDNQGGPFNVRNTIIAGNNQAMTSGVSDVYGTTYTSQGHNLVGNADGSAGFSASGDHAGTFAAPLDPKLGPLADNGGTTRTHLPLPGSPAIDAGSNTLAKDQNNNTLNTDQRGKTRFTNGTVDVGAVEVNYSVSATAGTPQSAYRNNAFGAQLQATVKESGVSRGGLSVTFGAPASGAGGAFQGGGNTATVTTDLDGVATAPAFTANNTLGGYNVVASIGAGLPTALFGLTNANAAPTDIALSDSSVPDNTAGGTIVGTFSTSDPDASDTFTYTLVPGAGGTDNNSFNLTGATLKTAAVFDFESKTTYALRVRSADNNGASREKQFIVNVTDGPDSPGALSFSASGYSAGEGEGGATVTLTRTGGADNRVVARVGLADVTTSAADYAYNPGALDASFNPGTGATSGSNAVPQFVSASAFQPDGKILIGGAFLFYNGTARNRLARLNADGTLDTTFNPGTGANGVVADIAVQPDGKILIAGHFTLYNGLERGRLARLNGDGTLDTTFNPGARADDVVRAIALQADGRILFGGDFGTFNGTTRRGVARLNSDGTLDTTFDPGSGANAYVGALALQPDGKLIVGGGFINFGSASNKRLVRLNGDGSVDASFNSATGLSLSPRAAALQPDGKLVVGGEYIGNDAPYGKHGIVRLNGDGSADAAFNPGTGANNTVEAVALQPDGKIVIGGWFNAYNGTPVNGIARLDGNGALDATFNPGTGANSPVHTVALQPDGKIILTGQYTSYNGTPSNGVTRVGGDLFVAWAAGDSANKTLSLPLVNDAIPEANETLALSLTPLVGGATTGARPNSTLTIVDNDAAVSAVSGAGVYKGTATLTATLTVGGSPLGNKSVGFTLNGAPAGSATTTPDGVATLTNASLAGVNTGTYPGAVVATFAGETNLTGNSGTGALSVGKANQTITFAAPPDKTFGDPDFDVSAGASASSDLSLSFTADGRCTVSGVSVHIRGAGSCTITATQAGDGNYNAASLSRSFQIAKAATATALSSSAAPSSPGQSVTFTATVTSAAGTPTGAVQFKVDGTNVGGPAPLSAAGVAALTTTSLAVGTHAVTADYGGDSNFNASSGALAGGQAVGSVIEFSQSEYAAAERGGALTVTVKRAGESSTAVSVDYATVDGSTPSVSLSCSATTGLALDRCDFTKALGTLLFAVGETEKTFQVLVGDDSYVEGTETAQLKLSNPTGGAALGTRAAAVMSITDDLLESSGNPIDDEENFVRQHYRDFLNREPDAAGLQFWTNGINSCGADAGCREVKRIDTSAAFFLSIEFQETGYLVYRMYKAAYGDSTSPNVSGTVPALRLEEFLPDTQRLGRGVVVGQGEWQQQLEANKQAFALEFVRRQRFLTIFPASLTAAQFVDRLIQNAGVSPSQEERDQLVAALGATPGDDAKRAQVLRSIVEGAELRRREFDRAFVLMQYYGYLRRNPDDAPDADFRGWKFWLTKLEEFGGDYRRAEMVKAFISSIEYRQRFGR